jgi:hypothetical protein
MPARAAKSHFARHRSAALRASNRAAIARRVVEIVRRLHGTLLESLNRENYTTSRCEWLRENYQFRLPEPFPGLKSFGSE